MHSVNSGQVVTPEISNELCLYAVDTKRARVSSFAVLLPCSLLKYLVIRWRICLDRREQVPVVLPQAEHFVILLLIVAHGVVLGYVCIVRNATIAALPVEFARCQQGNLPVAVPVPRCVCLHEVLSIFNLGEAESWWLKILCFLFDFSFLLINNSSQCCSDTYSLWKINSYRLLVTDAAFWCPDEGATYQLASSGAASRDQGIPLDTEDGWPSHSFYFN